MLVVGVTEICARACYYCPNPRERADRSCAGDTFVTDDNDIVREARLIDATSACITGGEPLLRPERAARFIALLKNTFGPGFQTHLYTCTTSVPEETFRLLHGAGLDEIRFHLHDATDTRAVESALGYPWRVGIEIPCIPQPWGVVREIVEAAVQLGVAFVNLNEFQMALSNHEALLARGMQPVGTIPNEVDGTPITAQMRETLFSDIRFLSTMQVRGSRELGMALLDEAVSWEHDAPTLHLCTTLSKFTVQKPCRDKRRAKAVAQPCDEVTERGSLLYGLVSCPSSAQATSVEQVLRRHGVPADRIRRNGRVLELPWFHAARLKKELVAMAPDVSVVIREESSYGRQQGLDLVRPSVPPRDPEPS
jgi:hypothetical protein